MPAPFGPISPAQLSGGDLERHVVEDERLAEATRHRAQLDRGHAPFARAQHDREEGGAEEAR